jgi:hypothetical protein
LSKKIKYVAMDEKKFDIIGDELAAIIRDCLLE